MISLDTQIATLKLSSCIFNASGPCDVTKEDLEILGSSKSSAIVIKSATMLPRNGNDEPRYENLPFGAIQSMGLPNLGIDAYIRLLPDLKHYQKPLIGSVAGLSFDDFPKLVSAYQKSHIDAIEVNLSCPNIPGKPQIAYDNDVVERILQVITNLGDKPLGLKLPPYLDEVQINNMASIISRYPVHFIVCVNAPGQALVIDPEAEMPLIAPRGGMGGLCGRYIKPLALGNVHSFYKKLLPSIPIIGVGGIETGLDVFEFMLAGASAVQIGNTFWKEGPECFSRISNELRIVLREKGYSSISEVIGKLKERPSTAPKALY